MQTYLALVIISVGIVLTCGTELELSILGVCLGIMSTFMTNLQTIFGKNLLDCTTGRQFSEMELQLWTCSLSAIFYFPIWCVTEGVEPAANASGASQNFHPIAQL